MGRIQSNIGIITGVPIGDTVDALMAIAGKPRGMLTARTEALQQEQIAVTELAAMVLTVQYTTDNLGKEDVFKEQGVASSYPDAVSATLIGEAPEGSYQFTPLRMVQSQQLLSDGFETDTESIGGGKLTFRFGDHVEREAPLEILNDGQGIVRGTIRVTDRSGAGADIDLSTAQSMEDVLEAINGNRVVDVVASVRGDRIRLTDQTGQIASNLRVQEVGGGTTAASLGLDEVNEAAAVADGHELLGLYEGLQLDQLNDGNGVSINPALPEVTYTLRDGTTGEIDFSQIEAGLSGKVKERTLGDVLAVINAVEPGKLIAEIAPDGDRLMLIDLTTPDLGAGDGTFKLEPKFDSATLDDLGLTGEAVDGVITGDRLLGGLQSVLLSSLDGGNGIGPLGALELTDRSGDSDTVDLSGAETLEDVIHAINAADVGITARANSARNGIELVDTTGSSASHMMVANADAQTATAEALGIAADADVTSVNSGDMRLQIFSHATRLTDLNGGHGVARGTMRIEDSRGRFADLNLASDEIQTVGDVMRAINNSAVRVSAEINATGDGILLRDLDRGGVELSVLEGNSTTARDLGLFREAKTILHEGEVTQVIDGSTTYTIELGAEDSLEDLRTKINESGAAVTASMMIDGSSRPYRLSLVSQRSGKDGALVVDTSEIGFSMQETSRAQDALLVLGGADSSVLVSSRNNTFNTVLPGVSLNIKQASSTPVTITVQQTDESLVANVQAMVENFNRFRERFDELTAFDFQTGAKEILNGSSTALRMSSELAYLFSGRFAVQSAVQTFADVGVGIRDNGMLEFDAEKLKSAFAADPDAVQEFFAAEEAGVSAKFHQIVEGLAGQDVSLLANRFKTLDDRIERNQQRIEILTERLEKQREALYLQFYRMELAIGKMQSDLAAVDSIQPFAPVTSVRSLSG